MTQSGSLANSIDLQVMSPTSGMVVEQLNASAANVNPIANNEASFVPMSGPIASREAARSLPYREGTSPVSSSRSSGTGTPLVVPDVGMSIDNARGSESSNTLKLFKGS